MTEKREKLFDMFPPVSTEEWRAKVEVDLKGVPFEKKLVWRTNEGFNVQPMYRAEDIADLKTTDSLPGEYPYVRGTRTDNNWLTRQTIIADSPEEANKKILDVVTKGINSIYYHIPKNLVSLATISTLLEGVDLEKIEVNLSTCQCHTQALCAALVEYIKEKKSESVFHGSIDFNPLKRALRHGGDVLPNAVEIACSMIKTAADVKGLRVIGVDSVMFSNAGAYITQELGYALAWGADWMTHLTDAGIDPVAAANAIKFNMGISSNYFMELSKFRAARMLWAQIVKQYNPSCECACKMMVHAETSKFNQTVFDAYVNLLRSQTEAMSAALAGVDSITSVPFDTPFKTPDDFSERIARNQQLLLKEESHLNKVVDPAGGSYYVETLTVSIANEAWKHFLEIEDKGGFLTQVADGSVQASVNASAAKRHTDVARRKEILLGTNQFPNINEKAASKIEKTDDCNCGCAAEETGAGLNTKRAAGDFEALRLTTEAAAHRPKVFMLTIGNLAMRLARAQFSTNFFGCAGYEIIDNLGFQTVEEGVDAAIEKGADVVVLCSSDDEYATLAPEAFKYLNGRAEFVVAGAPACMEDLKAAGINDFIHVRCNVLDTLKDFNARLLK